jgi:aspartate aminotransferase/aminotransferase
MLSKRIKKIKPSGIRKYFDLAFGSKEKFIDFSIGQPHFNVPEEVKGAAAKAIQNNQNKYTPTKGTRKLRQAVVKKLQTDNNIKAKAEDIIITAGTSGGIFLALSAILDPGDEIIIPDPYFVLYNQVATFLGAKIVLLDTYPDFQLSIDKLGSLVTKNTKAIIINSPNNPTGAVYTQEELIKLAELASKNNLIVLSDEVYEKFDYDKRFFSVGSIYDKTITLNGFSKSHAMTGWRVGYAHGPHEIIEEMCKLQQYTFINAPTPAQAAAITALSTDMSAQYRDYSAKRDYIYNELNNYYNFDKPQGAFYAFLELPKNKENFIDEIISANILAVPGKVFSKKETHLRISYAVTNETLEKGVSALKKIT